MQHQRGQSEIVGVILLIGLVLFATVAILAVGSTALESVQEESEYERDANEIEYVAHEIDTTIQSTDSTSEVDVRRGYSATDGARVTITVDGDTTAYNNMIGRLERDGFVYEGGLVIDAEDGRVRSSPRFEFEKESTLLQFPRLEEQSGQFDGSITHTETEVPIDQPEERLAIEIESEYYEQWAAAFEDAPATVTTYDSNETVRVVYTLEPGVESVDQALSMTGSSFVLNEMPETTVDSYDGGDTLPSETNGNARVEAITEDVENQGGDVHVEGEFVYDGEDPNNGGSGKVTASDGVSAGDVPEPYPTTEFLLDSADSYPRSEDYDGSGALDGGVFYSDSDLTIDDDTDVTRPSVLIVDGDLRIAEGTTLTVEEALDVHVNGEVILEEDAEVRTVPEHDATRASIFAAENVSTTGPAEFTGVVHATDASLNVSEEFTLYGAAVVDNVKISSEAQNENPNHNSLEIYYDERLENRPHPFATTGAVVEKPEEREQIVDVDEFDADETISGPTTITENKTGNVLVEGDLNGIEAEKIDGSLLVDGTIQDDIEGVTITGDLLVTDKNDVPLTKFEVEGDVRVVGAISPLEDAEIGGDLVVGKIDQRMENVTIDGDMRIYGEAGSELTDIEVTKIIAYEGLSDQLTNVEVETHVAVKNDLSNSLEGADIGGDLFVGGRASSGVADTDIGNNMTVRDGSPNQLSEITVGDDLMVEGRLEDLADSSIDNDIRLTEDYGTITNTTRNDTITDADPSQFPTFDDYLEGHTVTVELPNSAAEHAGDRHAFDVRVAELETD